MLRVFWEGGSRCGLPVLKLLCWDFLTRGEEGMGVGGGEGAEALDSHLVPFCLETMMTSEVLKLFASTIRMIGLQGAKILKTAFLGF